MTEFFSLTLLIRLVSSFFATIGFAIMFKTKRRHLLHAGISGVVVYFIYYFFEFIGAPLFIASLASTTAGAIYSEVYARVCHTPAIVILSSSVIPIVPGGSLYYTVQHVLTGENQEAFGHLGDTLGIGLGIACGIVLVSILSKTIRIKKKQNQ